MIINDRKCVNLVVLLSFEKVTVSIEWLLLLPTLEIIYIQLIQRLVIDEIIMNLIHDDKFELKVANDI